MKRYFSLICILIILLVKAAESQPANWNIEPVRTLWVTGAWDGFESDGEHIFASNGWGIMVYRFIQGEDEEPVLIERYPTPGSSRGLFLQDTLLYICDWPKCLRIWSVADVNNIYEVGSCTEEITEYYTIQVQGDYAYIIPDRLAHSNRGLRIVSVEDPTNPIPLSFVRYQDRNMGFTNLKVSGNYVYLSGVGPWPVCGGVFVVNAEDPENPSEMEYYGFDESVGSGGIELYGDTLLVRTSDSLYVVSVSDPEDLRMICALEDPEYFIVGDLIYDQGYLFGLARGVGIVDLSDIYHPRFLGNVRFHHLGSFFSSDGTLSGNYAFVGAGIYGWKAINISRYGNPVIEYDSPDSEWGNFKGIEKRGDYLFVTDGLAIDTGAALNVNRFRVFSVEDFNNPVEVASLFFTGEYARPIEVIGDIAYIGGSRTVFTAFDISNPENPTQLGRQPVMYAKDFVIQGDYAFTADNEIFVFSIADPRDIQIIGRYDPYYEDERHSGRYYNLGIVNNTLVISGRIPGQHYHLWTYDVSDPESLDSLGRCQLPTSSASTGLVTLGEYAYVGDSRGLYVISIADPHHPEPIWSDQSTGVGGLNIFDGRLYLGSSEGMRAYSLDDPERPEQVGIYDVPSGSCDIYVENDLAYLAGGYDLAVYDISRTLSAWYIGLSDERYDFGDVPIDSGATWELTITNRSRVSREITGIQVENEVFTCRFEETFDLPSGVDTSFTVFFRPDSVADYNGILTIVSEDYEITVPLTGRGVVLGVDEDTEVVYEFGLHGAYPNPFNSVTTVQYDIARSTRLNLSVYDVNGRLVESLFDGTATLGFHCLTWDASRLSSGLYLVRMDVGERHYYTKVALVK